MPSFNPFFSLPIVFLSMLTFLNLTTHVPAQFHIYDVCENTSLAQNISMDYSSNINSILSSLSSNANGKLEFYNTTANETTSDPVYGLFLCRGDVTVEMCQICVLNAVLQLARKCSSETVAVTWYDECIVRYSIESIFSTVAVRPGLYMWNTQNVTEQDRFYRLVNTTMTELAREASNFPIGGKKFGVKEVIFSNFQNLYSLVQCTPDLSSSDCNSCLQEAINRLPICCGGKQGGRVLFPSCIIRYEVYQFYGNASTAPAPPPPGSVAGSKGQINFTFDVFDRTAKDYSYLKSQGDSSIVSGALQITPNTINEPDKLNNKAGRVMYSKPFKLWSSDDNHASFNSTFLINMQRQPDWTAGEGLAFLIAPDISMPAASFGQWLGLTNAATDGNHTNRIVAIEFDTEKQDYDPDDNHIGLNINSVRSNKTVSLNDYRIKLSPEASTNHSVWVYYNGSSKLLDVYMWKEGEQAPEKPLLRETINLKDYVNQRSYFGFAASTGNDLEIELHSVLKWSLEVDVLNEESDLISLKIGLGVGVPASVILLILFGVLYVKRRRRRRSDEGSNFFDKSLCWLPEMPKEFKFKDIKKATNNFHESMRLGEGGFGVVYKGILNIKDDHTATEIAVKQFSRDKIKGKNDFFAELTIIYRLRHKHLVRLIGWCYEKGKLLLLYEFMPNGSLDKHLYKASNHNTLNWERRYKILADVASALNYLHNEYDQKVVHRDLKASNILLDSEYNARLSDFGLARALDNGRSSYAEQGVVGVPGTMGYVAPECFHTGKATPESDVFGFGAVVLEVVCGRSPATGIDYQQRFYSLVDWVWMLHREGKIQEAVDERLDNEYFVDEVERLLLLGLACSHPIASERPQALAICQIIGGTISAPRVPPFKPFFTWPLMDSSISTAESTVNSTATLSSKGCSATNMSSE